MSWVSFVYAWVMAKFAKNTRLIDEEEGELERFMFQIYSFEET